MGIKQIQANFSYGELDPKLLCRPDFTGYYKGARKLRNVLCIPQGGVKRRFGTEYGFTVVDTGDDNEPVTNIDEIRSLIFDFTKIKHFLIVLRPNDRTGTPGVAFDIYLENILQATVTSTAYTIAQIAEINFVKAQDRIIVLHKEVAPRQLVRGANDVTWTLSQIAFVYLPVFDFSIIDGVTYRGPTDAFTIGDVTGTGVSLISSNAGVFNSGHVGGIFIGGGGVMRITAVTTSQVAAGTVINDFDASGLFVLGVNALLMSKAWGDYTGVAPAGKNRGFPSLGAFFQNRLVVGNSLMLPNLLWASNVYDFYNFNDEDGDALDAFSIGIGSNGNEEIQDIVATKALVVLGFSGIYATSLFIDLPITPSNAFLNEQSRDGASALDAQIVDNQIFYVDENEQQVRSARYDIATSSFNIFDASLLSPQVISNPVSTASLRPKNDDGSFYIVVNGDGTIAIFQSLEDQSVNAWTLSESRGTIYQVAASRDIAYMTVRRSVTTGATAAGLADNIYTANVNFQAITDITSAAEDAGTDVTIFASVSDYVIIGHESPFYKLAVSLNTPASASIDPTFEYLDRFGEWTSFTPTDGTSGFSGDGDIEWVLNTDMRDWAPRDISENPSVHIPPNTIVGIPTKFWIRIRRNESTLVTVPIENTLLINIGDRVFLEGVDFEQPMDSAILTESDANGLVTGLTHLIGQQVYVLSNTIPEGPYFVSATGTITIKNPSTVTDSVQVGINFIPEVVPMPIVVTEQSGINIFQQKLIKQIYIYYYNSIGILVNGEEIPTLKVGSLVLDQPPIPVTGFYDLSPRRGWDPTAINTISQNLPLPFTIIGIGYILEAS